MLEVNDLAALVRDYANNDIDGDTLVAGLTPNPQRMCFILELMNAILPMFVTGFVPLPLPPICTSTTAAVLADKLLCHDAIRKAIPEIKTAA